MKIRLLGILTLGTLYSAALLQPVVAQERNDGFQRPARGAAGQHAPQHGKAGSRGNRGAAQVFQDVDGDGLISEAEFIEVRLARLDDHFSRLDRDGDGLISLEEQTPRVRPERPVRADRPERPARPEIDREALAGCVRQTIADYEPQIEEDREMRFENTDTNGDGFLSLAEVSTAMTETATRRFARMDSNADGFLSQQELTEHRANQSNLRRVVRACINAQSGQQ